MFSQIWDRKNGELDELKSVYRGKQKEADETIQKLEKRGEGRTWSRLCLYTGKVFPSAAQL